MFLIIA